MRTHLCNLSRVNSFLWSTMSKTNCLLIAVYETQFPTIAFLLFVSAIMPYIIVLNMLYYLFGRYCTSSWDIILKYLVHIVCYLKINLWVRLMLEFLWVRLRLELEVAYNSYRCIYVMVQLAMNTREIDREISSFLLFYFMIFDSLIQYIFHNFQYNLSLMTTIYVVLIHYETYNIKNHTNE